MMEWLRQILESAEIKDGKLDVDKIMSTVNTEAPKNVMSKTEYNSINEQLKTANKTIDSLKKDNADNEDLQKKIAEHETSLKEMEKAHKAEIAKLKKEDAIKDVLRKSNAKHPDLLLGKFDLEKIKINDDGSIIGLDEQSKSIQEAYKDLFEETDTTPKVDGLKTGEPGDDKGSKVTSTAVNIAQAFNQEASNSESSFFK